MNITEVEKLGKWAHVLAGVIVAVLFVAVLGALKFLIVFGNYLAI